MTEETKFDPDEKVDLIITDLYENRKSSKGIRLADAIYQALRVDEDSKFVINRENHKPLKSLYDARAIATELGMPWS